MPHRLLMRLLLRAAPPPPVLSVSCSVFSACDIGASLLSLVCAVCGIFASDRMQPSIPVQL